MTHVDLHSAASNCTLSPVDLPTALGAEPVRRIETVVDPAVVREIRRTVSERLATRLQAEPVTGSAARRELARSLLADELASRARARVGIGQNPWPVETEMAVAAGDTAASLAGLLQPLAARPAVGAS